VTVTDIKFIFYRACLRKANLSLADAESIVTKSMSENKLLYYYKCDFCSSYHLTSQEPNCEKKLETI
jgi:hypothetical protein